MKTNLLARTVSSFLMLAVALLVATPFTQAQPAGIKRIGSHWVGTWATSVLTVEEKLMPPSPPGLADVTLRQTVHVSVGGKVVRVRFSNAFASWGNSLNIKAATIAVSAGNGSIKPETIKTLTFSDQPSVSIPWGALMISDPVEFDLAPGSDLAITLHVGDTVKQTSGHRDAFCWTYVSAGNHVTEATLPDPAKVKVWYYLSGVDVFASKATGAIVCLGDSITDGYGSSVDANRRWPDFLFRRLQANPATQNVAVLNQGIGGNAVWRGGVGQIALTRFDRDVLTQPGARWMVLLEGVNDLGGGKTTAEEIITSYEQMIVRAHDRGLRIYGATILPCGGSNYIKEEGEAARQKINDWIRHSGAFDAVIDLDAALRDPKDPTRLLEIADCGDHLHPNDEGYRLMAEAVDLKLFEE